MYVDDIVEYDWELMHSRGLKWNRWCHLIADSHEELMAMAQKLRLLPSWIQKSGTPDEHFDLIPSKRILAIKHGAKAVSVLDLAEIMNGKDNGKTD